MKKIRNGDCIKWKNKKQKVYKNEQKLRNTTSQNFPRFVIRRDCV